VGSRSSSADEFSLKGRGSPCPLESHRFKRRMAPRVQSRSNQQSSKISTRLDGTRDLNRPPIAQDRPEKKPLAKAAPMEVPPMRMWCSGLSSSFPRSSLMLSRSRPPEEFCTKTRPPPTIAGTRTLLSQRCFAWTGFSRKRFRLVADGVPIDRRPNPRQL